MQKEISNRQKERKEPTLFEMLLPLLPWYLKNARPLPWRESIDPYRVWLSEIMLQQTRIEAVRPYYARFLAEAPSIAALAALPDERLMKLWEGLGYYSRARNLKKAACIIVAQHGGEMPITYDEIRALPGIGDYTAGAIASIVYGLPYPAVDGNVLRVLARLTNDPADITAPDTKKRMTEALREVYLTLEKTDFTTHGCAETDKKPTSVLTQALMELGQTLCLPNRLPICEECPLASLCRACAAETTDRIPYRSKKKERRVEDRLVLLLCNTEGNFAIRRRPTEGLLADLWELPNILVDEQTDAYAAISDFCTANGIHPTEFAELPAARHLFTHIEWRMRGFYINVEVADKEAASPLTFVTEEDLFKNRAIPSAFRAYMPYIRKKN